MTPNTLHPCAVFSVGRQRAYVDLGRLVGAVSRQVVGRPIAAPDAGTKLVGWPYRVRQSWLGKVVDVGTRAVLTKLSASDTIGVSAAISLNRNGKMKNDRMMIIEMIWKCHYH